MALRRYLAALELKEAAARARGAAGGSWLALTPLYPLALVWAGKLQAGAPCTPPHCS